MKRALTLTNFSGGWATDLKVGIPHSFAFSQSVDFRKSPSQITPLPRTTREDAGNVKDLVQNAVMTTSGLIYALGSQGYFYKRTTAGSWSSIGNISAGYFGLVYRPDQDAIYAAGDKSVSMFSPVSGTPTLQKDFFNISQSTYDNSTDAGFNVDADQANSTNTTAILTSYVEGQAPQERFFQTDIEPLNKISVYVVAKGTGNWTLTLHDGLNNQLATVTVTNANITNQAWLDFVFTTQVRAQVAPNAQTYHIHVTSTVADGTVSSLTTNDLGSCDLQVWADRMVIPHNGMHPMTTFQQFVCIGNEKYLSVWEPLGEASPSNTSWQRHKLTFPPGFEVCGLAVFNEYLAIACEKISTGSNSPQEGVIFFWDGLSSTYNYFLLVPEGSPYGIHQYKNVIFYYAGGAWYALGSVTSQPEKIRTMPFGENAYGNNNDGTVIYPYAATVRNGIQIMAWPSVSTNTNIQFGVYSWGQVDKNFANSFGYSYLISTGTQTYTAGNHLTIGMVQNFGDNLLISWRDTDTYGVDVVNSNSKPAAYSTIQSLIFDGGYVGKDKEAEYVNGTWPDLPDGVSVVLKYSINRGNWVYSSGATSNAAGGFTNTNLWQDTDGYGQLDIFGSDDKQGRFLEVQIGADIYCDDTVTTVPQITSLNLIFDDLTQEVLQ